MKLDFYGIRGTALERMMRFVQHSVTMVTVKREIMKVVVKVKIVIIALLLEC